MSSRTDSWRRWSPAARPGGDQRGEQSAALLVVRAGAGYDGMDNYIDISVYDHQTPIDELERLHRLNNLYLYPIEAGKYDLHHQGHSPRDSAIWQKRGFYDGEIDGVADPDFQNMLVSFMGWENYDLRIAAGNIDRLDGGETLMIDREVLEDIRTAFEKGLWKPKIEHR